MSIEHKPWLKNPKIYEINTWPWLNSLSEIYNTPITLQNIPEEIFSRDISLFDAIWLMGVWERSPASKRIALEHPDLQGGYHKALHEFRDEDVVGSPYSVYYYHVDKSIGGVEGLQKVRQQLSEQNIQLVLDYVPNHVAIDSLWTFESNLFIEGTLEDLMNRSSDFFSLSGKIFAHGRDPNYSGWTDTIQINAFSTEARQKTIKTLLTIAEVCDGVRCDMAMLMTSKVFSKTWGEKAGSVPEKEFWEEIISTVKTKFPNFKFIAEVYWNMEWELQQQGFDFCYDKRLYERLAHENASTINEHLMADKNYQNKLVRFIENHDELRSISSFGKERSQAAALIIMSLPGARLIHEGQMQGYRIKLPVQLGRREIEEIDSDLLEFYQRLLKVVPSRDFEDGRWGLCNVESVVENDSLYTNLISYLWWKDSKYKLIAVNYSPYRVKAHIKVQQIKYGSDNWTFTDLLTEKKFTYKGEDLYQFGLFIDLPPWNSHVFNIQKI